MPFKTFRNTSGRVAGRSHVNSDSAGDPAQEATGGSLEDVDVKGRSRYLARCRSVAPVFKDATTLRMPFAILVQASSRSLQFLTGFEPVGSHCSPANGAPFRSHTRNRIGTTRAFPPSCRLSARFISIPVQH